MLLQLQGLILTCQCGFVQTHNAYYFYVHKLQLRIKDFLLITYDDMCCAHAGLITIACGLCYVHVYLTGHSQTYILTWLDTAVSIDCFNRVYDCYIRVFSIFQFSLARHSQLLIGQAHPRLRF